MPKKKTISKKIKVNFVKEFFLKLKSFVLRHKIISIIIAATLLWALVWIGQVGVERYRFAQAEKKLDSLASEIQAVLPQDKQLIKEKSCAYSSRKFARGDRSCSIRYSAEFLPQSSTEATNIASKVKQSADKTYSFDYKKDGKNDLPFKDLIFDYHTEAQYFSIDLTDKDIEPKCYVSANYIRTGVETKKQFLQPEDKLTIDLSCYGFAKAEYFPLKD